MEGQCDCVRGIFLTITAGDAIARAHVVYRAGVRPHHLLFQPRMGVHGEGGAASAAEVKSPEEGERKLHLSRLG